MLKMPRQPTPAWMRPLWVRLAICAAPALWACVEAWNGQENWAWMFGAVAAWGFWSMVVKYDEADDSPGAPKG